MGRVHRVSPQVRRKLGGAHAEHGLAVIVGQAPSRHGRADRPLTGPSGKAIAAAAGLDYPGPYLATFDRVNVLEHFPRKVIGYTATNVLTGEESEERLPEHGDPFPIEDARLAALALAPELADQVVVLLGRGVARCFGMRAGRRRYEPPWYEPWHVALRLGNGQPRYEAHSAISHAKGACPFRGKLGSALDYPFAAITAPHPSRASKHWTDKAALERASKFWSELVERLKAGATAVEEKRAKRGTA
jgi:hypothetical protein